MRVLSCLNLRPDPSTCFMNRHLIDSLIMTSDTTPNRVATKLSPRCQTTFGVVLIARSRRADAMAAGNAQPTVCSLISAFKCFHPVPHHVSLSSYVFSLSLSVLFSSLSFSYPPLILPLCYVSIPLCVADCTYASHGYDKRYHGCPQHPGTGLVRPTCPVVFRLYSEVDSNHKPIIAES